MQYRRYWRKIMSISTTSKVSKSSPATIKSSLGARKKDEVDGVDTTNSVFVGSFMNEENKKDSSKNEEEHTKKNKNHNSSINQNQILKINEVIASDESMLESPEEINMKHNHVNIYNNNQTIIQKEKNISQKYAKHFYEQDKIIEEIDEFA